MLKSHVNVIRSTLRGAARRAAIEFGVTRCRLTHIASHHNDVFRVDTESGERFALRLQNDLISDSQARSQLQWLEALTKRANMVVPTPIRTIDNRLFTHVECAGQKRRALLLRWVPGRPATIQNDIVYRRAARMIARLHYHAEAFRRPAKFSCRQLDDEWLFGAGFFVRAASASRYLNASHRTTIRSIERLVRNAMGSLGHPKRRFGVIHADLNLDNVIFNGSRPSPIDFDEFGEGWFLFDLAELIRKSITLDNWAQRKQLVLNAYTNERKLDDAEVEAFDAFMVAAFVAYLNWAFLHARNKNDLKWVDFCIEVMARITRHRGQHSTCDTLDIKACRVET